MNLTPYPALAALHDDLTRLDAALGVGDAARRRARTRVVDGRDVSLVEYAGASYWLDAPQRNVVRLLLDALLSRDPEVSQPALLRAAGVPGVRRLAELFKGSPAWGALVIPGRRGLHFRLADPPEVAGEDQRRTVSED